jgi:hypothetical protein
MPDRDWRNMMMLQSIKGRCVLLTSIFFSGEYVERPCQAIRLVRAYEEKLTTEGTENTEKNSVASVISAVNACFGYGQDRVRIRVFLPGWNPGSPNEQSWNVL